MDFAEIAAQFSTATEDYRFLAAVRQGRYHLYCEFCARRRGRARCPAIADPVAAWSGKDGWCWAYTEDESKVAAEEAAVEAYAARKAAAERRVA